MSGLFSAAFLRQNGWEVDVYERSAVELLGRGGLSSAMLRLPFISTKKDARGGNGLPRRHRPFTQRRYKHHHRHPVCNTLINEASFGRFFEVTRDGEIVWEYVNPYFGGSPLAETNAVFRALRYSAEEIARAEATARA
jgi:hypothetical protein